MADQVKKVVAGKAKRAAVRKSPAKVTIKSVGGEKARPALASERNAKMTEMTDTVNETVKKIETTAKSGMEKGVAFVKDVVEFNRGNVEAMVESGKIAAKGAQSMGQSAFEYGKKNVEAMTEQAKKIAAVKSPTDFFKLHTEFVRSQFDAAVAETSKATELFVKVAGETMQPLQNRYALAAEKVKSRLAA